jgi:hypothetical protein
MRSFCLLSLTVLAAACGPSSTTAGPDGGAAVDGGVVTPTCKPGTTNVASGHHNAGRDCQGCHGGQGAPRFYVGGTAYTSASSTTPLVGATITVVDKSGTSVDLVTSTNGNFYTSTVLTPPLTVYASKCPTLMPMTATVTNNGGCNAAGCHVAGSSSGHVHL